MPSRRLLLGATAALFLTLPTAARTAEPLPVVASFSILGDLVTRVAGPDAAVTTLVGPDGDAHVYQPTPSDAKAVAAARLIFVNGLGFEGWMSRLLKSSGTKATPVTVTAGIPPRTPAAHDHDHKHGHDHKHDHGHGHGDGHGHGHGGADPHVWQNAAHVRVMVANIAVALAAADPAHAEGYQTRAAAYRQELDALDAEIRAQIGSLAPAQRRVITSHDAFGYYGDAYGVTFLSPQGVNTESQASAKGVARLITQMRQQKIKAVFVENISDPRLTQQLAQEAGATVGGELYSDALSPAAGPAASYLDLMRHNTRALAAAMARN